MIETQLTEARSQVRDLERELERVQADHLQVVSVEWQAMRHANTVYTALGARMFENRSSEGGS